MEIENLFFIPGRIYAGKRWKPSMEVNKFGFYSYLTLSGFIRITSFLPLHDYIPCNLFDMKDLLKILFMFGVAFSLINCSHVLRKNENTAKKAEGEVVVLNKVDFLTKVFNYEKNPDQWVYEGDKPCIVDFYADWCPPCKKVSPILKELALLYKDDIVIYKVDVDVESELAETFGIQSIPTLLFIPKDGEPQVAQGALPREELIEQIDNYLLGKN
jgi:thioredoxin